MMPYKAEIHGHLRGRQRNRAANVARHETRATDERVEAFMAAGRPSVAAMDGGFDRRHQRRHGQRYRGGYNSKTDILMDYACFALWGALLGCGVLFVAWTIAKI